jgi:hypothetical protein
MSISRVVTVSIQRKIVNIEYDLRKPHSTTQLHERIEVPT